MHIRIPEEDIKIGAKIRDVAGHYDYRTFTIMDISTFKIFGKATTLVDLRPKPSPFSGWINAEQIKYQFELVD